MVAAELGECSNTRSLIIPVRACSQTRESSCGGPSEHVEVRSEPSCRVGISLSPNNKLALSAGAAEPLSQGSPAIPPCLLLSAPWKKEEDEVEEEVGGGVKEEEIEEEAEEGELEEAIEEEEGIEDEIEEEMGRR